MIHRALSCAGTQLLRALIERTGMDESACQVQRFRSVDWQSLTFSGQRHELRLRLHGKDAAAGLARLGDGLGEAEWTLTGHIVADVLIVRTADDDGAIIVDIEALTLSG